MHLFSEAATSRAWAHLLDAGEVGYPLQNFIRFKTFRFNNSKITLSKDFSRSSVRQ